MSGAILPITDSFAVQRCMTWATPPSFVPQPPYIPHPNIVEPVFRSRSASVDGRYSRFRSAEQANAKVTPYAVKTPHSHFYSTQPYHPGSAIANAAKLPPYFSLTDPHLRDYYLRKFSAIDLIYPTPPTHKKTSANKKSKHSETKKKHKVKKDKDSEATYSVTVTTGDQKNAGTSAKVFITIKGLKKKLPKRQLVKKNSRKKHSFKFDRGTTQTFKFDGKDVGDVDSIVMEHNGVTENEGWFLEKVKVTKRVHSTDEVMSWVFVCQNWLSLHVGDGRIRRHLLNEKALKTEYEVMVMTGNVKGAGTDAHVFLTIFGKSGQTPKLQLKNSDSQSPFERNRSALFNLPAKCVGPMTKIRIEHDNTGFGPGWFLEKVIITDLKNKKWKYYFPCSQWLAKDEGDGQICRDLAGSLDPHAVQKMNSYKIIVHTGNKRGAGTDANVYITLFGDSGESGQRTLDAKKKKVPTAALR